MSDIAGKLTQAPDAAAVLLTEIPARFDDKRVNPAAFQNVVEAAAQALRSAVQQANVERAIAVGELRATVDMEVVAKGMVRVPAAAFRRPSQKSFTRVTDVAYATHTMEAAAKFIEERLQAGEYSSVKVELGKARAAHGMLGQKIDFEVRY
jgi:hypothetical protein